MLYVDAKGWRSKARATLRPTLLRSALAWWYLGMSREGWVAWMTEVKHRGASSDVARAARHCYGDIGGIAMLVWGPA